jgi:TolA-binding protein
MLALVLAAGGTPVSVTVITEIVGAAGVIASAVVTPLVMGRRRAAKEKLSAAVSTAVNSSDLTLAGWTALNGALQEEIRRLQGVQERMQHRIDQLEGEIESLQGLLRRLPAQGGS